MSTAILPIITIPTINDDPTSLIQRIIDENQICEFYSRSKGKGPQDFVPIDSSLSLESIVNNLTRLDNEEGYRRRKNKPERVQWDEIAAIIQATWKVSLPSEEDPHAIETHVIEAEGGFVFWLGECETARLDSDSGSVLFSVAWARLFLPQIPGRKKLPDCPKSDFGLELYFNPQKGTMGRYVYAPPQGY